jgi:hypothetical protein
MPTTDIRSVSLMELPESDARRALAAELEAGRAYLYKEIRGWTTLIIFHDGDRRLTCTEWLAEYTAIKNAQNAA